MDKYPLVFTRLIFAFLPILVIALDSCSMRMEADYVFVGKFPYKVIDDSIFSLTVLSSDSYGYAISEDLDIQALEIYGLNQIAIDSNWIKESDFIVSLKHPIKTALKNSHQVYNQKEIGPKCPLEIIPDTNISTPDVYIYRIYPKGRYRLLLP